MKVNFLIGLVLTVVGLSGIMLEVNTTEFSLPDWANVFNFQPEPPMVLFKIGDGKKLTKEQNGFIYGQETRKYLETHCAQDDKGNPDVRWFDKDADLSNESPEFQALGRFPGVQEPAVVIGRGRGKITWFPIPPDATEESGLKQLKKYGGE